MTKKTIASTVLSRRLGYWVTLMRGQRDWTKAQLAEKAEMKDVAKVKEIEDGLRSTNYALVERLAGAFGVDPVRLFQMPESIDWEE